MAVFPCGLVHGVQVAQTLGHSGSTGLLEILDVVEIRLSHDVCGMGRENCLERALNTIRI